MVMDDNVSVRKASLQTILLINLLGIVLTPRVVWEIEVPPNGLLIRYLSQD